MRGIISVVTAIMLLTGLAGCSKKVEYGKPVSKEGRLIIVENLDKGSLAGFDFSTSASDIKKKAKIIENKADKFNNEDVNVFVFENPSSEAYGYDIDVYDQGAALRTGDEFVPYSAVYTIKQSQPKMAVIFQKGFIKDQVKALSGAFLLSDTNMMVYNGKSSGQLATDVKAYTEGLSAIYLKKYPFLKRGKDQIHDYPVLEGVNRNVYLRIELIPQKNMQMIAMEAK